MPIYEFDCHACDEQFEELVFNLSKLDQVDCPHCGSAEIQKRISLTAAGLRSSGGSGSPSTACTTSL
jgi:putative FmdB family regulatory protein